MFQFEQYFDEHDEAVFHFIYFLVGHKETAEDLTQETFLRALKTPNYRGDAQVKTWLITIARNTVYDFFRRKKLLKFVPFLAHNEKIDHTYTPENWLDKQSTAYVLYEALGNLKFEYREAIVLRKIEGFSIKETAHILQWSESKVKNNTERGLKALRILLGGEWDEFR